MHILCAKKSSQTKSLRFKNLIHFYKSSVTITFRILGCILRKLTDIELFVT